MANVYLWDPSGAKGLPLPNIKYIGTPPALPVTVEPQTEEVEMSDKSRRLAFFGADDRVWREFTLGWGYLTKAELNILNALVAKKKILKYQNNFEDTTEYYVYVVSFSYEFVRPGIRKLGAGRYRADMLLREV